MSGFHKNFMICIESPGDYTLLQGSNSVAQFLL